MHWLGHDIRGVKHERLKKCLDISQKLSHLLLEKIQMYKSILPVLFCVDLFILGEEQTIRELKGSIWSKRN
jgi:hypothetical protein